MSDKAFPLNVPFSSLTTPVRRKRGKNNFKNTPYARSFCGKWHFNTENLYLARFYLPLNFLRVAKNQNIEVNHGGH